MKNLITSLLLISAMFASGQNADTTYWKRGGRSALTFSQVSLTNWAAGGQNSAAINSNLSLFGVRTKGRGKWENSFEAGFGVIKQGENDLTKSDDIINFVTKYGYQINKESSKWYFSGILDFRTQFADGFDASDTVKISTFMAPGYLVIGTGIDYYPNNKFTFSLQPITGKFTFVQDQGLANAGAFGVDPAILAADGVTIVTPGKNSRAELGVFFKAQYVSDIFESRLELFTGYTENFGDIDVNWQNALVMNVTKVLSMNIFTQLIYDKDILIADEDGVLDDRVQFKSVIGAGLAYNFGDKKSK
ncbi:MAG: DUF3078 domain-containing protein [Ekhidna sp.]